MYSFYSIRNILHTTTFVCEPVQETMHINKKISFIVVTNKFTNQLVLFTHQSFNPILYLYIVPCDYRKSTEG